MDKPLFQSFWMAGFEGACHIDQAGQRVDMIAGTQHDRQAVQDYAMLRTFGISTIRDGVRWHLIDRGGVFNFSSWLPMLQAALQEDIQVIWTLCHYGWPDDIDVFKPEFVNRFARYCAAVARILASHTDAIPFYNLINEVSFLAWGIGQRGLLLPGNRGRDGELKKQFIRATIAGCHAIWDVDKRARFVQGEPLIHVVPPRDRPDLASLAFAQEESQFEVWDALAGRQSPGLGGEPRCLDIIALHYYHANQWEYPEKRLKWEDEPRDDRWKSLHELLRIIQDRYQRPFFLGETSHFGSGRARWILEIAQEVKIALAQGIPLEGICIFPIVDRFDWEDPSHWHHSGLWQLELQPDGRWGRFLNNDYAIAVNASMRLTNT